jgi:Cu-processing system ATP-binding protein
MNAIGKIMVPELETAPLESVAIGARSLSRHYGNHRAVDGLDFTLDAGSTLALIGHNGAGKTTLMKLILGLIRPTSGSLKVLGVEPARAPLQHRKQIGFLPENVAFHDELTGTQTLRFYARLKQTPLRQCEELLERVGLSFAASRRVKTYSKGMRQRLGLAQALLGAPQLLLLDEPTTGLDPASRAEFFRIMHELSDRGATVIISSHILTELEAKTDLVAIMNTGHLAAFGPLDQLRREADLPVRITVATPCGIAVVLAALGDLVQRWVTNEDGHSLQLFVHVEDKLATLAKLTALGDAVADLDIARPGLDEIYRHFSPEADKEAAQAAGGEA